MAHQLVLQPAQQSVAQLDQDFAALRVVFAIGGPSSRKEAVCQTLAEAYGWYHLPFEHYLQELAISSASENDVSARAARAYMSVADLQSRLARGHFEEQHVLAMLVFKIRAIISGSDNGVPYTTLIVSGFPMSADSARRFAGHYPSALSMLLVFDCDAVTGRLRAIASDANHDEVQYKKRCKQFLVVVNAIVAIYAEKQWPFEIIPDIGTQDELYVRVEKEVSGFLRRKRPA